MNTFSCPHSVAKAALRSMVLLAVAVLWEAPALGQPLEQPPPKNTCVLDFHLPAGAKLHIDGKEYQTKRLFTYRPLQRNQRYVVNERIVFSSGAVDQRPLFLEGGRHIHVALRDPQTPRPRLSVQTGHASKIRCVAISPDRHFVASANWGNQVILWEATTGKQLVTLKGLRLDTQSLAFSNNGQRLLAAAKEAVGGYQKTDMKSELVVWDVSTGSPSLHVRYADVRILKAAFSDDDSNIIALCHRQQGSKSEPLLILIDAQNGKRRNVPFSGLDVSPDSAMLSSDGQFTLFLDDASNQVSVWKVATGNGTGHDNHIEFPMARPIALDRKGRLVGEDIETHELVIRDVRDGRRMSGITMTGTISKSYSQVVFSPDGRFLATACHDFGNPGHVQVWDFEKGLLKAVLRPTDKSIQQLHFSSDGKRLLVVTFEDAVIVEVGTGETVWTLPGQSIMAAGLSPDGKTVVTKGSKTATWNAETGKPIHDFGYTAAAPVFSPDGKHLFVNQCLTEIETNRKVRTFDTLKHAYGVPVFSRDGTRLAIVGAASDGDDASNRTVIVSDVASGRELRKLTFRQVIRRIGLSPDGRNMLVSFHGRAELFDVASGQRLLQLGKERKTTITSLSELGNVLSKTVGQAVLSPDGRYIAALSPSATTIVIYDADSGMMIRTLASGLELVQTAALSPDGTKLITFNTTLATEGGLTRPRLIHWDLTRNRQLHNFQDHREVLSAIALTHDGEQLVTGGEDGIPILWDVASGRPLRKFVGNRSRLRLTGFRSAGRVLSLYDRDKWVTWSAGSAVSVRKVDRMISGLSADGEWAYTQPPVLQPASIWNVSTGKTLATLHSSDEKARWSHIHDISPDKRYLFSSFGHLVFNDGPYLWDARNGRLLRKVAADVEGVNCARFLPNSREVIVSSLPNGTLQSLSVPDGRRLRRYIGHSFWIVDIAFSRGARRMVTGSLDRTAIIWDIATARSLHVLRGHSAGISCVTYGSSGRYVATASHDGVIKVWNAAGGQLRRTLEGHDASVRSLAFDTTETTLASTSDDGTVRLWDVTTGQQIASLVYLNDGRDWLVSTPEGLFDGSDGGRQAVHFRIGNSLHVVPVDRFFQDFYYPGLLESVWNGQRPLPQVTMGESAPPMLRVVSPDRDGSVDKNVVTIEIEVTDQGGGVKGPWVMHNGARVIVRGTAERTFRGVRRKFTLPLIEGKNRIEIRAASADGSWESEPAILNLACNEPLEKPSLFVVSVGVDDYAEADMKLNYAVRDAESLASLFRERGAQLYDNVQVLTVEDRSATRDGILAAIRHVAFETRPQDTVVLFLAGQGALVGDRYYFLPQDFRRTRATVEESIRSGGMLASEIAEQLATTPALKRLLLFDTCRANEKNTLTRTSRNPFALRGAIERLTRSEGTFTIAGVATNDKVQEVDELKHGVLTYSLLAGLRDVDAGPLKNQWVTTEKGESLAYVLPWFSFASRQMPQLTKKYFGSRQEVQQSVSGASFPVLPVPQEGALPVAPVTVAAITAFAPPRVTATPGQGATTLHVVAIGINTYQEATLNLKFAAADAEAIAELFENRGRRLFGNVRVTRLIDHQATRDGIQKAIAEIAKVAQPADTLVVFLAGHGAMVGQRYFFLPHEFHRQGSRLDEDLRTQGLAADVLGDAVAAVPALKRILIVDTCASGGALTISRQGHNPLAFRGAIDALGRKQGVFTIAASSASEEAQEIDDLGHGVLTYALLAALHGVDRGPLRENALRIDTGDGVADVLSWFSYASGQVPRLTRQYLGQAQEIRTSGQGQSFPVLPLK